MDERDEFEFSGAGCLYGLWFGIPLALLSGGYWLIREDGRVATALGIVLLVAAFGWLALEFVVRRRP